MKHYLYLISILLLLSSCVSDSSNLSELVVTEPLPASGEGYTAVLLVDEQLGEAFLAGAQRFSKETARLTDNNVIIEVRTTEQAANDYSTGKAQIIFLSSAEAGGLSERFAVASTSFLYPDYDVFTMAANTHRAKKMLEESVKETTPTILLGGYYAPSCHFVSAWQPTNLGEFNQALVAVDPATGSAQGFSLLGAGIVALEDPQERLDLLVQEYIRGAEFTLEELYALDLTFAQQAEMDLYLTLSYHTVSPVWLMVSEGFYMDLPPAYQAAMIEASSYLYAVIDQPFLLWEGQLVLALVENGFLLNPESFSEARGEILRRANLEGEMGEGHPMNEWEVYMWKLVTSME